MKRREKGLVMVVTLVALAGIITGIAIFSENQNNAVQITINRTEQRRARIAAYTGLQYALASIQEVADNPQSPVTADDNWAQLGQAGEEEFRIGNATFRLQIVDNSSLIDLNTVTEEQLVNLNLTQDQIDALLDWREADTNPRALGAKDEYYNSLARPYNTHLNRIQSVTELLVVKDFTPQILFQTNTNTVTTSTGSLTSPLYDVLTVDAFSGAFNPEGDGKANVNNPSLTAQVLSQTAQIPLPSAQTIINQRNIQPNQAYPNLGALINLPGIQNDINVIRNILDRMTVSATERVGGLLNLNTVSQEVLQTVPGISQDIASQIISNRPSGGYQLLSELLTVSNDSEFLTALANNCCVNSQTFLVRVEGRAGRTRVPLIGLIQIDNAVPKIIRIEQPPLPSMPARWLWNDASIETTILENQ